MFRKQTDRLGQLASFGKSHSCEDYETSDCKTSVKINIVGSNCPDWWWPCCGICEPWVTMERCCQDRNFNIADAPAYSCDAVTTTATFGYISSPLYPRNYPNNARCTWKVQASNRRVSNEIMFFYHSFLTLYSDLVKAVFLIHMPVPFNIFTQSTTRFLYNECAVFKKQYISYCNKGMFSIP